MSALPSTETPDLDLDGADSVFRAAPPAPPIPDETFEEELLRDAYLPKDGSLEPADSPSA